MRLIFLGAPGTGKGTQAQVLTDILGVPKLSTSDILRSEIASGAKQVMPLKAIMDAGQLVPDDIMNALVAKRLQDPDVQNGFIFDGYPRTLAQAEALQEILKETNHLEHTYVLNLFVSEPELIRRFAGRVVCAKCGASYHVHSKPPKVLGVCDKCGGGDLFARADDSEEAVKVRLASYYDKTEPLINYYSNKGMLYRINGEQEISSITDEILTVLGIKSDTEKFVKNVYENNKF